MSSFTSVGRVMTLFQVSWMDQNSRSARDGHRSISCIPVLQQGRAQAACQRGFDKMQLCRVSLQTTVLPEAMNVLLLSQLTIGRGAWLLGQSLLGKGCAKGQIESRAQATSKFWNIGAGASPGASKRPFCRRSIS